MRKKDPNTRSYRERIRSGELLPRIRVTWHGIRVRVGKLRHYENVELNMTYEQFKEFSLKDPDLRKLTDEWIASNYQHAFAPSVDRIKSDGHYEIGNIRYVTIGENARKAQTERWQGRTYLSTNRPKCMVPGCDKPRTRHGYTVNRFIVFHTFCNQHWVARKKMNLTTDEFIKLTPHYV